MSRTQNPFKTRNVVIGVCLLCLSACGSNNQTTQLQRYMQEVKARPSNPVEPIPAMTKIEPFTYHASNLRSPFKPSTQQLGALGGSLHPDQNRRKEALEAYPIDALTVVGMLEIGQAPWALIAGPNKTIHQVTIGNYLGQDFGKIIAVSKNTVTIKEIVPDGQGNWRNQERSLSLVDDEKN